MSDALILNQTILQNEKSKVKSVKVAKNKAIKKLKEKLEQTKLDLIYTELEEAKIKFERKYSSVKELQKDLNEKLDELEKNRLNSIVNNVNNIIDSTAVSLENGSTNAFTKLMSGDLMKTIAKTLGISLAGRTALILAPTVGTKALIGLGMAGYSLYKVVKNRKEIIKANEINELNNIMMELECTKIDEKYVDTRFNIETQKVIREFLAHNNITFDDTGYRALRQTIYSLSPELKRGLCELLNNKNGKGIEISERVAKAKKKLNVVASTTSTISVGASMGITVANMINDIDPALVSGTLNGTLLGIWTEMQEQKEWLSTLSGSLTLIGSEVLERLPWGIGGFFEKVFSIENLAVLTTLGATGGLIAGTTLSLVSAGMQVKKSFENKSIVDEFNKLDKEKYQEEDKAELQLIKDRLLKTPKFMEGIVIDILMGYFKDRGIAIDCVPKDILELRECLNRLKGEKRREAHRILAIIANKLEKDPSFVEKLKHAGKVSIGMFTTGLAVLSVYDIIKNGTFLPELSQTLFNNKNLHAPVPEPEPLDKPFDPNNASEKELIDYNEKFFNQFQSDEYMTEYDGSYLQKYGHTYSTNNNNYAGVAGGEYVTSAGTNMNFVNNILKLFGIENDPKMVLNVPAISKKINELSPEKLYNFYRYFSSVKDDGSELYKEISFILSSSEPLKKASSFINSFETRQKINNFINKSSSVIGTGVIPLSTIYELLGFQQKKNYNSEFEIKDNEFGDSGLSK